MIQKIRSHEIFLNRHNVNNVSINKDINTNVRKQIAITRKKLKHFFVYAKFHQAIYLVPEILDENPCKVHFAIKLCTSLT